MFKFDLLHNSAKSVIKLQGFVKWQQFKPTGVCSEVLWLASLLKA